MKTKESTNEAEFLEQVNQSQGIIHKVCRLYCDDEEHRKDLFQEILINLWKSYHTYRGEAQFSSWMYRVALNVAIQDFRKVKKRKLLVLEAYEFSEQVDPTPPAEMESEKFRAMHQAIGQLDKLDKAIVLLHLDGHRNEEIGQIVGITTNYVRVKMNRIKIKLSKKLKS
ncbi:MAG: RNA polymerase sigma factor [Ekhidna sp.]|uniref:RNA polymerase sigma factor n=1 Tax=Ekhidna sp. TaxID=2608089 RepID=UPI0032EE2C31